MYLAIGVFDGVHPGHKKVIEKAHHVITFDPHPAHKPLLTTVRERKELIKNLKVIKFTDRIKKQSPEEFVLKNILKYKPQKVFVGPDFHFGNGRSGNADDLRELGKEYGFDVEVVPEVSYQDEKISSTRIRNLLLQSNIVHANELLGREYSLIGKIIRGQKVGRQLGFPTINLKIAPQKIYPGHGSYAGYVIINNRLYDCAIFIGERSLSKTRSEIVIEAHMLNYQGKKRLYGKECKLFFKKFIRPVQKFKNREDLISAIEKDIEKVT
jgi:riboflavin kinase/FMN adenylyltransferase